MCAESHDAGRASDGLTMGFVAFSRLVRLCQNLRSRFWGGMQWG